MAAACSDGRLVRQTATCPPSVGDSGLEDGSRDAVAGPAGVERFSSISPQTSEWTPIEMRRGTIDTRMTDSAVVDWRPMRRGGMLQRQVARMFRHRSVLPTHAS